MATEFRNMEISGDLDESSFSGWVRGRLNGVDSTKKCKVKECTQGVGPTLARYSFIPLSFLLPKSVPATTSLLILAYLSSHPQRYLMSSFSLIWKLLVERINISFATTTPPPSELCTILCLQYQKIQDELNKYLPNGILCLLFQLFCLIIILRRLQVQFLLLILSFPDLHEGFLPKCIFQHFLIISSVSVYFSLLTIS